MLGHVHLGVSGEGLDGLHGDALGLQLADEDVPAGVRRLARELHRVLRMRSFAWALRMIWNIMPRRLDACDWCVPSYVTHLTYTLQAKFYTCHRWQACDFGKSEKI